MVAYRSGSENGFEDPSEGMNVETMLALNRLFIGIKGAGEMASGIACGLYASGFRQIFMTEIRRPLAVRRGVSFCEAVYEGRQTVEEIEAVSIVDAGSIQHAWSQGKIAVLVDPKFQVGKKFKPDVLIDAILSKKNLGTGITDAHHVIGVGPGFAAGVDTHMVIETERGHNLGRIITSGTAAPNTGIPGTIDGYSVERVFRSPGEGVLETHRAIGDRVGSGEVVGHVGGLEIHAKIDGVIRGLLRTGTPVIKGLKLGDIDPRGKPEFCTTISDKARTIAGSVLEAVLRKYNPP